MQIKTCLSKRDHPETPAPNRFFFQNSVKKPYSESKKYNQSRSNLLLLIGLIFTIIMFLQDDSLSLFAYEDTPEAGDTTNEISCKPESFMTGYEKFRQENIEKRQIQIWYSFGYEEFKHKQYKRAVPYFWKVLLNDSSTTYRTAYSKLATCYFELTKKNTDQKGVYIDSTLLVIYRGLAKYPANVSLHFLAGKIHKKLDRTNCAIPHYEALVKKYPKKKNYWKTLAKLYFEIDDQKALTAQKEVAKLPPKSPEDNNLLAKMMAHFGIDALKLLIEIVKKNPQDFQAALGVGKELYTRGEYKRALSFFRRVLKVKSRHVEALTYIARCYEGLNKTPQALATYKKALKIKPKDINVLCSIASAYSSLNNFPSAISYVTRAQRINRRSGLPHMIMGDIYEKATSHCLEQRNNNKGYSYDDKLVFEKAGQEYKKAAKDLNYKGEANQRYRQVKAFFRTAEDKHLYSQRKKTKDACYNWIK